MDGFRDRDRMGRGASGRGSSDRYDRYDSYSRGGRGGSSYQSGSSDGVSADEIAGLIEDSNAKQLDIIHDFFADAKGDTLESEKQIISAIDNLSKDLSSKLESKSAPEPVAAPVSDAAGNKEEIIKSGFANKDEIIQNGSANKEEIVQNISENKKVAEEILKIANSNNDLLASFAEEQLPMLIRGNTSTLNQITQSLETTDDVLRQILSRTNNLSNSAVGAGPVNAYSSPYDAAPSYSAGGGSDNSEEILNTVTNNGSLLNALRTEVATVQQTLREMETGTEGGSAPAGEAAPLDNEDMLTKSQADELYKQLEEQIHSECVKVYRNLQKTLEDQNKAVIDGVGKSSGTVRIFALLAFIFSLFNLIIGVLTMLGIFPL